MGRGALVPNNIICYRTGTGVKIYSTSQWTRVTCYSNSFGKLEVLTLCDQDTDQHCESCIEFSGLALFFGTVCRQARLIESMMGLRPRQGYLRLVFRLFSLMRGLPSIRLK